MAVVPGAFLLELARRVHRELFDTDAVSVRHIEFENPVILNDEDIAITVRIEKWENGRVTYELFEATSDVVQH
ncbi:MAG: hypothetical protein ABI318_23500, partial [Chthoniobacteraceae bacterium]